MVAEGETVSQNGGAAATFDGEDASSVGESEALDMEVEAPDLPQNSNPTESQLLETSMRVREEEQDVEDEERCAKGGVKRARVEENSMEEERLKVMTEEETRGEAKKDAMLSQGEVEGRKEDVEGAKGEEEREETQEEDEEQGEAKEGEEDGGEAGDQKEEIVKVDGGSAQAKAESGPVKLGPKTFDSSVEMFNYFYKFLHFWPPNVDINKYERMIFLDLLKKGSLEAERKMGSGVPTFQVRVHPEWQSLCFFVVRTDGSSDDFSYRKCIDKILPLPENMKAPANADVDKALAGKRAATHRQGGGVRGKRNFGRGRGRNRK